MYPSVRLFKLQTKASSRHCWNSARYCQVARMHWWCMWHWTSDSTI